MIIVRLILRAAHILGGVFWVGSVFAMVMAVVPAMKSSGGEGGVAIRSINPRLFRLGFWGGVITLLSGLLMYIFAFLNLQVAWLRSGSGISITIGALAGVAAFVYAGAVLRLELPRIGGHIGAWVSECQSMSSFELNWR
jgi:hypothetical protein